MNTPLYSVEREYAVELDILWKAWVEAEQLQQWYSPEVLETVPNTATSEAVVGGEWAIGVDVSINGFNAYFWGKYTEVKFQEKLVHTMFYSQDELEFNLRGEDQPHHVIEIDFESRGENSWVRFTQFGSMDPEQAEATKQGMQSYFNNLESYLSKNVK
ncbi:MAG: hypothetical protein F2542_03390 [Actinobacteria bacterium]|uniref:Unannotated protein n=1 Tax=freshwater metagenome TaxID=449393 RepID=A0A6J6CY89_9ZZZZ|nr:hypothetical protein [Actinomycetota bacterium]